VGLAPAHLAEAAASTAPVLPLFFQRALFLPQAKEMERFTAYLAEHKLGREKGRNGIRIAATRW